MTRLLTPHLGYFPRQPLPGPVPERHPLIPADTEPPFCDDCDGTGFDTDDDGSMTGVAGAWMVCGCFPDTDAAWPVEASSGRGL